MSYQAVVIVLALALLLSGVAEKADNDLNEALGIKDTPLLQLIVGIVEIFSSLGSARNRQLRSILL